MQKSGYRYCIGLCLVYLFSKVIKISRRVEKIIEKAISWDVINTFWLKFETCYDKLEFA